MFIFIMSRSNSFKLIYKPTYYYELILLILTFLFSGFFAIYLSVPGNKIKYKLYYLPILSLLFWALLISLRFLFNNFLHPLLFEYHSCIKDILLMSIPSASILIFILNKRLPLKKKFTGLLLLSAASSSGALGISFLCPNEMPIHLLSLHVLPVLALSLLGIILSNLIFIDR